MSAALTCRGVVVRPGGGPPVLRGVDLEVAGGERAVLVGPSGAGKTTLLRAIAGLAPLCGGAITLGDRALEGIPAHRRRTAVVFQEPRLLAHLDVCDNVALPLRAGGTGRRERRARARARLGEVGLGDLAERGVAGLSGGEAQRVSLARALCAEPQLLLLDEPLAALDPDRRAELRGLIARVQRERGLTTLLVTHDRGEAAELGERVALMLDGAIAGHDTPRVLFEQPPSEAVARFFGMTNLVGGTVRDGHLALGGGAWAVGGPDGAATIGVRPEHLRLDAASALRASVEEVAYAGSHVRVLLRCGEHRLVAHAPAGAGVVPGAEVGLAADAVWRLPAATASAPPARSAAPR